MCTLSQRQPFGLFRAFALDPIVVEICSIALHGLMVRMLHLGAHPRFWKDERIAREEGEQKVEMGETSECSHLGDAFQPGQLSHDKADGLSTPRGTVILIHRKVEELVDLTH